MRRTSQLCALSSGRRASAPAWAETDQEIPQVLACPRVLLGGEHFGERRDDRRPDRVADALEALGLLLVGRAQVGRDVLHQRAAREAIERRGGVGFAEGARVPLLDHRFDEPPRLIEVAHAHEIVRVRDDGVGDVAPARRIGLDVQQVGQEVLVEAAQGGVADRRQPGRDALGRVVAHPLDVDRQRAGMRQLARVVLRDVAGVGVRRQHLLDAVPESLELLRILLAPHLGRGDLFARECQQLALPVEFGHQSPERVGEPFGGATLGDDRISDEAGDRPVAHALDERAHHVDAARHRLGPLPFRQERNHRLDRQVPRAAAELFEDRVQLLRVGTADVIHQPADDVEEGRGLELDALWASRRRGLERLHQLLELARILDDVDDRPHRRIVDGQRRARHRRLR